MNSVAEIIIMPKDNSGSYLMVNFRSRIKCPAKTYQIVDVSLTSHFTHTCSVACCSCMTSAVYTLNIHCVVMLLQTSMNAPGTAMFVVLAVVRIWMVVLLATVHKVTLGLTVRQVYIVTLFYLHTFS